MFIQVMKGYIPHNNLATLGGCNTAPIMQFYFFPYLATNNPLALSCVLITRHLNAFNLLSDQ
jgi:hypothetical protein